MPFEHLLEFFKLLYFYFKLGTNFFRTFSVKNKMMNEMNERSLHQKYVVNDSWLQREQDKL